ncbi:hypothetical protein CDAR_412761 [Caerostris darwini]|uniref:Uncharacterized protein n=1 Tax=Caerostris darwini TaxID=1538125 RepID=A0AAV4SEJ9_9ARAC|nr:hypothetical protein CDAR_412761 [Caerostris darwini]
MLNQLCPCFPPVAKHEVCTRCFLDEESSSNKVKKESFCSNVLNYSFSVDEEPFLPLTTEMRTESTRDNRRIPDDICLPSSTNRYLSPSNNQMSPTHGFGALSINKHRKRCFWRIR